MFVTGEEAIKHLLSRDTHLEFDYGYFLSLFSNYVVNI